VDEGVVMSVIKNKTQKPKLVLKTKLHRKLDEEHKCSNCGKTVNPIKHYYHSNRGRVYLCVVCEPTVRHRSFKKNSSGKKKSTDALDRATHVGHYHSRGVRGNWY
jgi:predicted amidophosphoribosyltransferase